MTEQQLEIFNGLEGQFKQSSIDNSKRFFKRIIGIANAEFLDFRKDSKKLIKLVNDMKKNDGTPAFKISSQSTMLKAMVNFFQLKREVRTSHYKDYTDRIDEIENIVNSTPKKLTERQSQVDFKEGMGKFLEFITDNDFDIVDEPREALILSFILLFAPRRLDWVGMKYSTKFKGLDENTNYLVETREHKTFVFNVFKTDKTFKQQKLRITNPVLIKILDNFEFKDGDFIYNKDKRTLQRNIAKQSDRFFGEPLSVADYRVIISSEEAKPNREFLTQLKNRANESAHGLSTRVKTYIRDI